MDTNLTTLPQPSGWWLSPTVGDLVTCLPRYLLLGQQAPQLFSQPFSLGWCGWCWGVRVFYGICSVRTLCTLACLEEPFHLGVLFPPHL